LIGRRLRRGHFALVEGPSKLIKQSLRITTAVAIAAVGTGSVFKDGIE
jgi:hypothetical protein